MNNSEYAELRDSMNKAIHCIKTLAESIGTDSTPDIPKDSIFEVNYFLRVALDMWQDDIDDTEQEGGYNNPWEMFSLVMTFPVHPLHTISWKLARSLRLTGTISMHSGGSFGSTLTRTNLSAHKLVLM